MNLDNTFLSNGDISWSAQSCDLTLPDFFGGFGVKDRIYANDPQTINDVKQNIGQVTNETNPQLSQNVIGNLIKIA